ncbi:hypothetical protein Pmani_017284 [Petrolisthes manimaculis]|uniref:Uncharacterized protein n=1 Tax=Petrolisthes manimaculis TaxID=1843537 RepID=A0AAE1U5Y6_9EUCA|nr:hypothetical protein Pmani_017284 [Petrolisthes manimaculis]
MQAHKHNNNTSGPHQLVNSYILHINHLPHNRNPFTNINGHHQSANFLLYLTRCLQPHCNRGRTPTSAYTTRGLAKQQIAVIHLATGFLYSPAFLPDQHREMTANIAIAPIPQAHQHTNNPSQTLHHNARTLLWVEDLESEDNFLVDSWSEVNMVPPYPPTFWIHYPH